MKQCPDTFNCPYQATFDTLWKLEATDPGYCEYYYGQPDSKCPNPLSKASENKSTQEKVKECNSCQNSDNSY